MRQGYKHPLFHSCRESSEKNLEQCLREPERRTMGLREMFETIKAAHASVVNEFGEKILTDAEAPAPAVNDQSELKNFLLKHLRRLFVGRDDCYCKQNNDGSYARIDAPLTLNVLISHLNSEITVGSYQLGKDNTVKYLCFDFDPEKLDDPKAAVEKLLNVLLETKEEEPDKARPRMRPYAVMLEASRYDDPSFHVWVFFEPRIPAQVARWLGFRSLELAGLNPKQVEVFPKQPELSKDRPYGNFVKLPLGLHRKEGKRSRILDHATFEPLPNETLETFRGLTFSERDLARILSLKSKANVQIKFNLPTTFKPLSAREEEKSVKFLCRYWKEGYRNDLEMYFLGFCLKKGVAVESARRMIEEVVLRTGDNERAARLALIDYHYQNRLTTRLRGLSGIREIVREVRSHGTQ